MSDTDTASTGEYRVLARKYRPQSFDRLIGQEALVQTLSNAMKTGRLAHAFVLTGVRGVGKTTTARIIAKGLNCIGADGSGGPTVDPCGTCDNCIAISEDRHVDVIEMDAASRTGVDDIREIIEGVRYRPQAARYKVYIIDEVHMLSRNAFNALLKTLEEPPDHVKFVFATTEIRKVPITVLSRCQRFDLRRIDVEQLAPYFEEICRTEQVEFEPEAIALIARAADGSARDGLSLLDQAIALGSDKVGTAQVQDMLGLADRGQTYDLLEETLRGKPADAVQRLRAMYAVGADPIVVMQDLLDLTHWVTRIKTAPSAADEPGVAETDKTRGKALAEPLTIPSLARAWQMLLKGLGEVQQAPSPVSAAEMVLIRLAYAADLPTPGDLAKMVQSGNISPGNTEAGKPRAARDETTPTPPPTSPEPAAPAPVSAQPAPPPAVELGPEPEAQPTPNAAPQPQNFQEMVDLFEARGEMILHANLVNAVRPIMFEPGLFEFQVDATAPRDLPTQLAKLMREWTGQHWQFNMTEDGPPTDTLGEMAAQAVENQRARAAEHPVVAAVLEKFPGSAIESVEAMDIEPISDIPDGDEDGDEEEDQANQA